MHLIRDTQIWGGLMVDLTVMTYSLTESCCNNQPFDTPIRVGHHNNHKCVCHWLIFIGLSEWVANRDLRIIVAHQLFMKRIMGWTPKKSRRHGRCKINITYSRHTYRISCQENVKSIIISQSQLTNWVLERLGIVGVWSENPSLFCVVC